MTDTKTLLSTLPAAILWGDASREAHSLRTPSGKEMRRYAVVVLAASVPLFYMAATLLGSHVFLMALTALVAALAAELAFALVRKRPIGGGTLPFACLLALILPVLVVTTNDEGIKEVVNMPLWIVAMAAVFGTVIGKEIFGGFGDHIFCPALIAKAFTVWSFPTMVQLPGAKDPELLAQGAGAWVGNLPVTGTELCTMGEFTTCVIIIGIAGLAMIAVNFRNLFTLAGIFAAGLGMVYLFKAIPQIDVPYEVSGYFNLENFGTLNVPMAFLLSDGFLFGACLLACDPAVNPRRPVGALLYGLLIGTFAIPIRHMAAYHYSTMMSAILLASLFAPLFDSLSGALKEGRGSNDEG